MYIKKIFLLILFATVLGPLVTKAQVRQGAFLIGASSNINYTSVKPKDQDSYNSFNIDLKGGYFVIDNLAFGLNTGYLSMENYTTTLFGIFGRYYIQGKGIVGLGYNSSKSGTGDNKAQTTIVPIEVGYAGFVSKVIAIEPLLTYSVYSGAIDRSVISVSVGFSIYLNRK